MGRRRRPASQWERGHCRGQPANRARAGRIIQSPGDPGVSRSPQCPMRDGGLGPPATSSSRARLDVGRLRETCGKRVRTVERWVGKARFGEKWEGKILQGR